MEEIQHKFVNVNGVNLHVAEKGHGDKVILFLHGFPEIWYTWRGQITGLAALGYRTIAPDLRGYGDSGSPSEGYTCHHIVGDIIGLIESLGVNKVFIVGHDWGAMIGWYLCMFRPDKVKAYLSLTVPFRPRHPMMKPIEGMRAFFGEDCVDFSFIPQDASMEGEISKYGTEEVLKKVLTDRKPGPPCLPKKNPFGPLSNSTPLPSWFSKDDLKYYTSKFNRSGFTGPLNYYRALDINWELTAPWSGSQVYVPVKFIVGDLDMIYTTPGMKEYIHGGGFKRDVPLLEETVIMEGVGHFLNQERADEINSHIHNFFQRF